MSCHVQMRSMKYHAHTQSRQYKKARERERTEMLKTYINSQNFITRSVIRICNMNDGMNDFAALISAFGNLNNIQTSQLIYSLRISTVAIMNHVIVLDYLPQQLQTENNTTNFTMMDIDLPRMQSLSPPLDSPPSMDPFTDLTNVDALVDMPSLKDSSNAADTCDIGTVCNDMDLCGCKLLGKLDCGCRYINQVGLLCSLLRPDCFFLPNFLL